MKRFLSRYNKDHYGGGLMVLLGLAIAGQGLTYKVGTLSRMGPGFFPLVLGVILALIGVAILVGAKDATPKLAQKPLPPEWRGWILICLSLVAFIVLGIYGGLLPATFSVVFISAMGDRKHTVKSATVLALSLTVLCVVVFWWLLDMQFPLLRWG